jgi:hypothetical protein
VKNALVFVAALVIFLVVYNICWRLIAIILAVGMGISYPALTGHLIINTQEVGRDLSVLSALMIMPVAALLAYRFWRKYKHNH